MRRAIALTLALLALAAPPAAGKDRNDEIPAERAERLLQAGLAQIAAGDFDPAILTLTGAREAAPDRPEIYEAIAAAYRGLGVDQMALTQLERSAEIDSTRVAPRLALAEIHLANRRYAEAARAFRSVLRLEHDNDEAAVELGRLYARAKQPSAAVIILEGYVARNPDDLGILELFLQNLLDARLFDRATTAAEAVLDAHPDLPVALRTAGLARLELDNPEKTIQHLLNLERVAPLAAAEQMALGRAFLKVKNDAGGILRSEKARAMQPDTQAGWNEIAAAYMRSSRWREASGMYERKIAQDSTAVTAWVNYGLCHQQLKDYDAARTALLRVTRLKPDYVKGWSHLAGTYVMMDSTRAARRAYNEVIRLALPEKADYRAELFDAYRYLSVGRLIAKDWNSALDSLDKAVNFRPEDVELRLYRGQAFFALNRKAEAKKEFETVLRMQPDNKEAKKALNLLAQYN